MMTEEQNPTYEDISQQLDTLGKTALDRIAELEAAIVQMLYALEMVRAADDGCKAAGIHPLPIPPIERATIEIAVAKGTAALDRPN